MQSDPAYSSLLAKAQIPLSPFRGNIFSALPLSCTHTICMDNIASKVITIHESNEFSANVIQEETCHFWP